MPSNPVKNRPTAVIGSAVTLAGTIVAALVANGVISEDVMKRYGAWISLAALAGAFLLLWFHVTPAAAVEDLRAQVEDGALPDVDHDRILAGVAQLLEVAGLYDPQHAVGAAHPDWTAVGVPDGDEGAAPEAGMSAGAP